jgi:putative tryptophan/tyrosine transport system substrate-binding protein
MMIRRLTKLSRSFCCMSFCYMLSIALWMFVFPLSSEAQINLQATIPLNSVKIAMIDVRVPERSKLFQKEFVAALRGALGKQGLDIQMDVRPFPSIHDLSALCADIISSRPHIVIAGNDYAAAACAAIASNIPILFASENPVTRELRTKAGKNITGITSFAPTSPKRWEIILETIPNVRRIGLLFDDRNPGARTALDFVPSVEKKFGVKIVPIAIGSVAQIASIAEKIRRANVDALDIPYGGAVGMQKQRLVDAINAAKVPAFFDGELFAHMGGLLSYEAYQLNEPVNLAEMAAEIILGKSPADMPVRTPNEFRMVINLATAKRMNIVFPPDLLVRAHQFIAK